MRDGEIAAVVLAAGFSSRMGAFKPLLPVGGLTLTEHVMATFRSAGVGDIVVVGGHRAGDLAPVVVRAGGRFVLNATFRDGMFSSVCAGVRALGPVSAFFVHPVDIPFIEPETVAALLRAHGKKGGLVCYPAFRGRRGHPPLLSGRLARGLLAWPGAGGLRGFLAAWDEVAVNVIVEDAGVTRDLDTPSDFAAALAGRGGPAPRG